MINLTQNTDKSYTNGSGCSGGPDGPDGRYSPGVIGGPHVFLLLVICMQTSLNNSISYGSKTIKDADIAP